MNAQLTHIIISGGEGGSVSSGGTPQQEAALKKVGNEPMGLVIIGNDHPGLVIIGCRSNNYFQGCGGGWFRGRTPRPPWHKAALTGRKSWQRDRKRNQCNYRSKLINLNLRVRGSEEGHHPGTKPSSKR